MKSKYILYARKSSEDKNRQVTSIEDQIAELTKVAARLNIEIVEVISESRSAKAPGREGFNRMLELIQMGKAEGILCWKLDRLARNPIDHGKVAWMLQNEVIKRIYTHSNEYKPSDNVLMMQVEFGMATQYVRDLNVNVRRGMRQKAERGWFPSPVLPIGYRHNREYFSGPIKDEIIPDKNYKVVAGLWNELLTGSYSIADIKKMGDKLGLKSKNGRVYSKNTYHLLFRNPFYAGYFYWNAEGDGKRQYKGKHKPMISISDFAKAQKILDATDAVRARLRQFTFPYRGTMSCGECDGYVTAEKIHQVICTQCKTKYSVKTNPKCRKCGLDFHSMKKPTEIIKKYYRCSKKKCKTCTQKSIEEKEIDAVIIVHINQLSFTEGFFEWGHSELKNSYMEYATRNNEVTRLQKEMDEAKVEFEAYTKMRAREELTQEQYKEISDGLNEKIFRLEVEINAAKNAHTLLYETAKRNLELIKNFKYSYQNSSPKQRNKLLMELGYNLVLKDKKVSIIKPFWVSYANEQAVKFEAKISRVQPEKSPIKYGDLRDFIPLSPKLLTEMDLKRT